MGKRIFIILLAISLIIPMEGCGKSRIITGSCGHWVYKSRQSVDWHRERRLVQRQYYRMLEKQIHKNKSKLKV